VFPIPALYQLDAGDEHVNQLDADERDHQSTKSVNQQVLPQQRFGAHRLVRNPSQRQRNQATMMSALKITAESIADCGVCSRMTFSAFSTGNVPANMAGMMA